MLIDACDARVMLVVRLQAVKLAHEAARRIGKKTTVVIKGPQDVISGGSRGRIGGGGGQREAASWGAGD